MIRHYEVYENGKQAGMVMLGRRGLYWAVSCRCDADRGRGKRLVVRGDPGRIDLGWLYPVDGRFGLETTVPVKKLGEGEFCFALEGPQERYRFIALDPEKPFAYLDQLEQCRFAVRDGRSGLLLPEKK